MRDLLAMAWLLVGCTTPTPLARVTLAMARAPRAVLALPMTCNMNCDERDDRIDGVLSLREEVEMLVRLKLELAGYTLAEAATMRLVTADRTTTETLDDTQRSVTTTVTAEPTVGGLPLESVVDVATALGLDGIVSTGITSQVRNYKDFTTITVELRAIPGDARVWRVVCEGFTSGGFGVQVSAQDLANCIGDGVLAVQAPDALFRKLP